MIVDAHMHVWNRIRGTINGERPVVPLDRGRIRVGDDEVLGMPAWMLDCRALAEFVVAEFDAAGVDAGVVVQEYMDGEQNDYLMEVVEQFPGRFFVHGLPDFFRPDVTAGEAFALLDRGFRGIKIPAAHVHGRTRLDDARLMPIYERMEAEGHVLAVDLAEGEEQAAELEAVVARFPGLKVAVGHFALPTRGGWPAQLVLARHENVFIEGGGLVWLYRDEGYPFPGAIDAILRARDEVGIDKLMWGSDWPRTMTDFTYRQSLDFVRRSDRLDEDEKAAFLGGTAARLYGLSAPDVRRPPLEHITAG